MQRKLLKPAITICAILGLCSVLAEPASANEYTLSGTFDSTTFSGPLNGGSFWGSYSVTGLPIPLGTTQALDSWDIYLVDAQHNILSEILSNEVGDQAYVDTRFSTSGTLLNFSDPYGHFLELQFTTPFNGSGDVIPFAARLGSFGSFVGLGTNSVATDSAVASGVSVASEPSSIIVSGLGIGLLLLGRRRIKVQKA